MIKLDSNSNNRTGNCLTHLYIYIYKKCLKYLFLLIGYLRTGCIYLHVNVIVVRPNEITYSIISNMRVSERVLVIINCSVCA